MPAARANPIGKKITKKTVSKQSVIAKKPKRKPAAKVAKKVTEKSTKSKSAAKVTAKLVRKTAASKRVEKIKSDPQKRPRNINQSPLDSKDDAHADAVRKVALEHLFKKNTDTSSPSVSVDDEIRLPSSISIRAIEKVKVISSLLDDSVVEKVRKGAYGLSFSFILFGSLFTMSQLITFGDISVLNSALLSKAGSEKSIPLQVSAPTFKQLDVVPTELIANQRFSFELTNMDTFETRLVNVRTQQSTPIETKKRAENEYQYELSPVSLESSDYEVHVIAKGAASVGDYVFTAARFTAITPDIPLDENETESTESDEPSTEETEFEEVAPDSESQESIDIPATNGDFVVFLSKTTFSTSDLVYLQVPDGVENVTVHTQKVNSFTPTLAGKASKDFGAWRFFLNTTNLPNGIYDLIIKGTKSGITLESSPKRIEVNKTRLETDFSLRANTEGADLPEDTEVTSETDSVEVVEAPESKGLNRDFSELSLAPVGDEVTGAESEKIVTEFLRDRKSSLEILLRNYSAAMQSADAIAVALAKEALDNEKRIIIESNAGVTEGVSREIDKRFASLQSRIQTFEDLRRSANDGLTSLDTDEDGISDFDEEALFKTDPDNPDTDGDGIIDGVEIMRGFNPLSAAAEALLMYESPRDSIGLTNTKDILISNVTPIVFFSGNDADTMTVQTRIVGRALPNTYVTLYVFSTPTITTVKTDANGAFSYILESELEDGTHHVYAAITDNTGDIIVQSNPFAFTKKDTAFVVGGGITALPDSSATNQTSPYNVAIGLSILALGIILLMLGIGLRAKTPAIVKAAA